MIEKISAFDKFVQGFEQYRGKHFEVVTGRNAYTFNKIRHIEMVKQDGVYLLIENPPQDDLKYKYDKALFIPAKVVDSMLATNDPAKVKQSFHLAADTVRFTFHNQIHKLYTAPTFIFKVVEFDNTRRTCRITKKEFMSIHKIRNINPGGTGYVMFICTVIDGDLHRLVQVTVRSSDEISENFERNSTKLPGEPIKSTEIHLELSAVSINLLDRLGIRKLLIKEVIPLQELPRSPPFATKDIYNNNKQVNVGITQAATSNQKTLGDVLTNTNINPGVEFKIVLPDGGDKIVIECVITKCERIENKQ